MRPAILVFTKLPVIGQVKTRLASSISEELAAELQKCFISDIISLVKQGRSWEHILSYAPENAGGLLNSIKVPMRCIPQKGSSLGERIGTAFREAFAQGFSPAVMIGTDIPTLPIHFIRAAFEALKNSDVVLGPAMDGGYYLIGIRRLYEDIFRGIDWSTSKVLQQTVRKIKKKKLKLACLEPWYDVDTGKELLFLKSHIECLRAGGQPFPENSYRFLKKIRI